MEADVARRGKRKGETETGTSGPTPWRQLVVDCADILVEPVSAVLLEEGALGLEVVDDSTRAMPGRPTVVTRQATLVAPFSPEPGLEARVVAALGEVVSYFEEAKALEIAWHDLYPEDWNAAFKAEWKPLALTEKVWVCPSWIEDFEAPKGAVTLRLDPGLAFGTGTHETTRLCARALESACAENPPRALLDVGTGSGILSITALKLGVGEAIGTEIDAVALSAAVQNAIDNDVGDRFKGRLGDPDADHRQFPAVVANILAEPLIFLSAAIASTVAPGGRLWLSGVLVEQAGSVTSAYLKQGLTHLGTTEENGWVRIDFSR